jgi:tetratricopeptide (TPR) repeat protein
LAKVAPLLAVSLGALLSAQVKTPEARAFESIRILDGLLSAHPDDASVETELALNYLVLDQRDLARAAIQHALQVNPNLAQAHYLAGRLALEVEQNPRAALPEFQRTLELEPASFKAFYYLGTAYGELGLYKDARNSLLKAVETATYSWPFRSLAETDLLLNLPQEALSMALKAVEIEPESSENRLVAAKVYQALGDLPKSIDFAQRAIQSDPLWDAPHFLLGKIYALQPGKSQQSSAELHRFRELKEQDLGAGAAAAQKHGAPQARTRAELIAFGSVAQAAEPMDAIRAGERFLSQFPQSEFRENVLEAELQAFRTRNDYLAVRRIGREILKLNPENVAVLAELALLLSNQGDASAFADAADYATRAIQTLSRWPRPAKMTRTEFARWKANTLASAHAAQGILALRGKDAGRAISELQESVRLQPDADGLLYLRLGEAFAGNRQLDEAKRAFARAEALGPEAVTTAARQQANSLQPPEQAPLAAEFARARDLEKAGQLSEAAEVYEHIAVTQPDVAEVFHNLGLVYYRLRDYAKAADRLQNALRINPAFTNSRLFLGLAQFRLAQFDASAGNLELFVRNAPATREAYLFLIRDYLALGRFHRDVLNKALALAPADAELNYAVGMSCLDHIRLIAREANDEGPGSAEFLWLSLRRAEQRQDAKAIEKYTRELAGAHEPTMIRDYDSTAELLDRAFQTVLRADASSREAHSVRGYVFESRNQVEDALREYGAAGDNFEAGRLLAQNTRYAEAERVFAAAVEQDPQNDRAKADLAKVYLQTNQPEKAIGILLELTRRYPADAYAWADLGKARAQVGDAESGAACFRKALELDPSMNQVHYQLAMLYRRIGKGGLAAEELRQFEHNKVAKP